MKLTAAAAAVLFGVVLTTAIAIAGPNTRYVGKAGRCSVPGGLCGKLRLARDAEAKPRYVWKFAKSGLPGDACGTKWDAEAGMMGFCGLPGEACSRAKRSVLALADALAEANPSALNFSSPEARAIQEIGEVAEGAYAVIEAREARYTGQAGICGVRGQGCGKTRNDEALACYNGRAGKCGVPGHGCGRKRFAGPDPDAEAEAQYTDRIGKCGVLGEACRRKRESLAEVGAVYVREANPVPEADAYYCPWFGRCGIRGEGCGKAKREADADARYVAWFGRCGIRGDGCGRKRSEEEFYAELNDRQAGFCGVPGEPCFKTRRDAEARYHGRLGFCGVLSEPCGKTKRDVDAERQANLALKRAYGQFMDIKRDADAAAETTTLETRAAFCDIHDCTFATRSWIEDAAMDEDAALEEREACFAPEGDCSVVKRALDELEATISKAVADIT